MGNNSKKQDLDDIEDLLIIEKRNKLLQWYKIIYLLDKELEQKNLVLPTVEKIRQDIKNEHSVDQVKLIQAQNRDESGELEQEILNKLQLAFERCIYQKDFSTWKWFKANILESDVKFFQSSYGIALFWLFNEIANEFTSIIEEFNDFKLKSIQEDPRFNDVICNLSTKVLQIDSEFEEQKKNEINNGFSKWITDFNTSDAFDADIRQMIEVVAIDNKLCNGKYLDKKFKKELRNTIEKLRTNEEFKKTKEQTEANDFDGAMFKVELHEGPVKDFERARDKVETDQKMIEGDDGHFKEAPFPRVQQLKDVIRLTVTCTDHDTFENVQQILRGQFGMDNLPKTQELLEKQGIEPNSNITIQKIKNKHRKQDPNKKLETQFDLTFNVIYSLKINDNRLMDIKCPGEIQMIFKQIHDIKESVHTVQDITRQIDKWKVISRGIEVILSNVRYDVFLHQRIEIANTQAVTIEDYKNNTSQTKNQFYIPYLEYAHKFNDNRKFDQDKKNLLIVYENCCNWFNSNLIGAKDKPLKIKIFNLTTNIEYDKNTQENIKSQKSERLFDQFFNNISSFFDRKLTDLHFIEEERQKDELLFRVVQNANQIFKVDPLPNKSLNSVYFDIKQLNHVNQRYYLLNFNKINMDQTLKEIYILEHREGNQVQTRYNLKIEQTVIADKRKKSNKSEQSDIQSKSYADDDTALNVAYSALDCTLCIIKEEEQMYAIYLEYVTVEQDHAQNNNQINHSQNSNMSVASAQEDFQESGNFNNLLGSLNVNNNNLQLDHPQSNKLKLNELNYPRKNSLGLESPSQIKKFNNILQAESMKLESIHGVEQRSNQSLQDRESIFNNSQLNEKVVEKKNVVEKEIRLTIGFANYANTKTKTGIDMITKVKHLAQFYPIDPNIDIRVLISKAYMIDENEEDINYSNNITSKSMIDINSHIKESITKTLDQPTASSQDYQGVNENSRWMTDFRQATSDQLVWSQDNFSVNNYYDPNQKLCLFNYQTHDSIRIIAFDPFLKRIKYQKVIELRVSRLPWLNQKKFQQEPLCYSHANQCQIDLENFYTGSYRIKNKNNKNNNDEDQFTIPFSFSNKIKEKVDKEYPQFDNELKKSIQKHLIQTSEQDNVDEDLRTLDRLKSMRKVKERMKAIIQGMNLNNDANQEKKDSIEKLNQQMDSSRDEEDDEDEDEIKCQHQFQNRFYSVKQFPPDIILACYDTYIQVQSITNLSILCKKNLINELQTEDHEVFSDQFTLFRTKQTEFLKAGDAIEHLKPTWKTCIDCTISEDFTKLSILVLNIYIQKQLIDMDNTDQGEKYSHQYSVLTLNIDPESLTSQSEQVEFDPFKTKLIRALFGDSGFQENKQVHQISFKSNLRDLRDSDSLLKEEKKRIEEDFEFIEGQIKKFCENTDFSQVSRKTFENDQTKQLNLNNKDYIDKFSKNNKDKQQQK